MKKAVAAIILLLYFTFSTGFVVSLHYCMDRLAAAQVGEPQSDACGICGMQKDNNCCRDDVKVVKLTGSHLASSQLCTDVPAVAYAPFTTHCEARRIVALPSAKQATDHGPPISGQQTYLFNRVFRI